MSTDLVDPMASVRAYLAAEKSPNTRRAYATDWAAFHTWCESVKVPVLPALPVDVARYVAGLADAGRQLSSIVRAVAAIRTVHLAAGQPSPTMAEGVKAVMRGIRRSCRRPPRRKAPATDTVIAAMLAQLPDTLTGKRDRALLLLGFAAALRRSELVDLKVNDVEHRPKGILLHIRRSKTDQEARGQTVVVPNGARLTPVDALEAWVAAAGIADGPLFRAIDRHGRVSAEGLSDRSVARIVKQRAAAAGLDAALFSGHSLRAGYVTTALDHGVDPLKVMKTTRHADVDTLAIYDRRGNEFDETAGKEFL